MWFFIASPLLTTSPGGQGVRGRGSSGGVRLLGHSGLDSKPNEEGDAGWIPDSWGEACHSSRLSGEGEPSSFQTQEGKPAQMSGSWLEPGPGSKLQGGTSQSDPQFES